MRWKYTIPTLIILAAITLFNIFFFDALLRRGLILAGEFAFGAKVEIVALKTKFSQLAIEIRGVQVADRQNPMTNLFEVGDIHFRVQPWPLLLKKVVIDEMTVAGVGWGTARKTSGALPPHQQKKIDAKQAEAQKNSMLNKLTAQLEARGKAAVADLPALQDIQKARDQFQNFSADKMLKGADLQSLKQLDNLKGEYQQKAASYDSQLKTLDVSAKIQGAQPVFNDLGSLKVSSAQDALAAKDKIARAQSKVQELQGTYTQLQKLKTQAEQDFGQSQQLVSRINDLKDKDLKALSGKFQLPTLSYQNLARSLVGPLWFSRVNRVLGYIALARHYMPPRKPQEKKMVRQRLRGVDVSFPVSNRPPDFLIRKILLSGSTGGAGKKNTPLDFKGEISDITTDPVMLGRPTQAHFSGSQGGQSFSLLAVLNHTREIPEDSVEINLHGVPADSLKLPDSEYIPSFGKGKMAIATRIKLTGDILNADLQVTLSELGTPKPSTNGNADMQKLIQDLWKDIPALTVQGKLTGPGDNLQVSVTSNLDAILSQRLKVLAGGKLAELQQKLRAEVDKQLAGKQKEVMAQFDQSKKQVLGKLGVDEKQVQDKINAGSGLINQKGNAVSQAADQQKKQAEDQLKNKAQEQLQHLFGR